MQERRRGRPRVLCERCGSPEANREKVAARKRAYYEANREKVAARKRAYYEANREKVAARQRAYRERRRTVGLLTVTCARCGEHLARRTEDGLCGFCRQGI